MYPVKLCNLQGQMGQTNSSLCGAHSSQASFGVLGPASKPGDGVHPQKVASANRLLALGTATRSAPTPSELKVPPAGAGMRLMVQQVLKMAQWDHKQAPTLYICISGATEIWLALMLVVLVQGHKAVAPSSTC